MTVEAIEMEGGRPGGGEDEIWKQVPDVKLVERKVKGKVCLLDDDGGERS